MTIQQAHKEFQLFLDKVDSQALPDFLPQEIDIFLHEAEVRVVKSYLPIREDQRRADKINNLLVPIELTLISNQVNLPEDYLSFERCQVEVSRTGIQPTYVTPYVVSQGKLNSYKQDPFNKTRINKPLIYLESNKIKVDVDNFTANKVNLVYYKYPIKVSKVNNINSELSESLQKEAISMAVLIALESIESARTSTNAGLLPTTK